MAFDPYEQLATVSVVDRQSALMVQTYGGWPEVNWQRQTYCTGWTAADVVAHLATGADFYTQVIGAALDGQAGLPWRARTLEDLRQIRAVLVQNLLGGGPAALLAGFEAAVRRLQNVLESLHMNDLNKMAWHPRGAIPIGQWVGMRLVELVVHDWDIRQPHEGSSGLSPMATPSVLTCLPEMQLRFLQQRLSAELDGLYTLSTEERHWTFKIQGKTVVYQAGEPTSDTARLRTNPGNMILLTLGRADLEAQLQSGACALTGNLETGRRLYAALFSPYLSSSATPPPDAE